MRLAAVGFALGVWLLQRQPELPGIAWLLVGLASVGALLAGTRYLKRATPALVFAAFAILGFCWAAGFAQLRLADRLDAEIEGRDLAVSGVIAGLPQGFERGVRFDFDVESAQAGVPQQIVLSWYSGFSAEEAQRVPAVHAGERWRFTVRLRRPHGSVNPHGFDYEAWLLERGIRATGYVRLP